MAVIDLSFVIQGETVPLDHSYALYSALTGLVPEIHSDLRIGVHPFKGFRLGPGLLGLNPESRLRLRVDSERIGDLLPVAGSFLNLNDHLISVGVPRVEALTPSANLASRMVTLKGKLEADSFLDAIKRLFAERGLGGIPSLVPSDPREPDSPPMRRIVRIQGRSVVGFALRVNGLTAEESILLQEEGLGGRRHMGCGIFLPY